MHEKVVAKSGDGGVSAADISGGVTVNNYHYNGLKPEDLVNSRKPPQILSKLPLVLGNRLQKQETEEYLKECQRTRQKLKLIVLRGSKSQGHGDFVERYQIFLLPSQLRLPKDTSGKYSMESLFEHIPVRIIDWPIFKGEANARYKSLLTSLSNIIKDSDKEDDTLSDKVLSVEEQIGSWLAQSNKHLIFVYYVDDADEELLKLWMAFWQSLDSSAFSSSVSVFFCLFSRRSLPFIPDWSQKCIGVLDANCKPNPEIKTLTELTSPNKTKDPDHWAMVACKEAWNVIHTDNSYSFPFDTRRLGLIAKKAFPWWSSKHPLPELKPKIEKALVKSYHAKNQENNS